MALLSSHSAFAYKLKAGDVILQPLKCWSCSLIEDQENSQYSHIGIVVEKNKKLLIAEAYGLVKLVTLEEFIKKTHPNKKNKVLRIKNQLISKTDVLDGIKLFLGNPYDRGFLWNNYIEGREVIYCSELVYKVLNPLVKFNSLSPKRMSFDENPELWDRYFRGQTPRGELGISPEDFNISPDFFEIKIKGL